MQIMSRKYEFEADAFAANTIEDPEAMVDVLKKLSKDNLSNLTPHPFYVFLNYSHPPVLERIKSIREVEKSQQKQKPAILK
jgi:STE24 endopeptidase